MRRQFRAFKVLMSFSFRAAPREATLFLLSGALMSLVGPVVAYGAKLLVDAALSHSASRGGIAVFVLALSAGLGLVIVLYYIDMLFSVAEKAGAAVDRQLIALLAGVPGLAHHEQPEYLDQLDLLREQRSALAWMTNATAGIVRVAVQLLVSGVLLARIHPALLLLPLAGLVSFLVGRKAQILEQGAAERTTEPERLRRHLFERATSAAGGKEVRVLGLAPDLQRRHHEVAQRAITELDRAAWQGALLQTIDGLVTGAAYAAAIGLVLWLAVHGHATPGDVVLAAGLAAGMSTIVMTAVLYGTSFLRVLRVAGRFVWLQEYASAARATSSLPAVVPERLQRGITFQDVSFQYPGTDRPVLRDVSFHLPAGSVVALVGENGAGKSTLVKLLERFYEPDAGRILVDGIDLHRMPVDSWREATSAAFQDFARFQFLMRETVGTGSLRELNNTDAVQRALVHAGAETVPQPYPQGLETQLGRDWEGGVDLSGGQWQKLALARGMMRRQPLLLVLDEPTASLDAPTEHDLFERYAGAARTLGEERGTITLLVTHRFSTVRMADLIVVLEGGRVTQLGSHADLMTAGGMYADLYELQSAGYR